MRSTRSTLVTCVAAFVLVPALALANGIYVPGVGARASLMGGAFTGLADDYSAVFWNPAGITQIKGMEVTVTGQDVVSLASREGFMRFEGLEGDLDGQRFAIGEIGVTSDAETRIAPGFFFYTDPGPLSGVFDKVGLTAYTLTDYGSKWNGDEVLDSFVLGGFDWLAVFGENQDFGSRIKTYVMSPVVAKEVLPGLSVGVTANIAYSHLTIDQVFYDQGVSFYDNPDPTPDMWGLVLVPVKLTDDATAWGYGATVGVLYRVTNQVSAGLTVRSPMTMAYEGTFGVKYNIPGFESVDEKYKEDLELRFPMWVGAGLAYRDFMFDGLTLTGDVQWTDWSTFEELERTVVVRDSVGEEVSVVETVRLDWDDTIEIALGFDYRLGRSMSVGMGYRYSPNPAPNSTYDFIMPQTTKNVIGMGVTYYQDFWRASFGLEYHAGDTRNITPAQNEAMRGKHVEDLLVPTLSFTYAF